MKLSNRVYDKLKWFAMLGANAISGFLVYCGQALNNNNITIAAGMVSALGVCVAGCLGLSTMSYNATVEPTEHEPEPEEMACDKEAE